jgi:hypothetical protein
MLPASVSFEFQSDIADMTVTAEVAAREKEVDHAPSLSLLPSPSPTTKYAIRLALPTLSLP